MGRWRQGDSWDETNLSRNRQRETPSSSRAKSHPSTTSTASFCVSVRSSRRSSMEMSELVCDQRPHGSLPCAGAGGLAARRRASALASEPGRMNSASIVTVARAVGRSGERAVGGSGERSHAGRQSTQIATAITSPQTSPVTVWAPLGHLHTYACLGCEQIILENAATM